MKGVNKSFYKLISFNKSADTFDKDYISRSLTNVIINEALYCLHEGIIKNPRDGDVGAIMGLGFPPFLGGPFRYVDKIGASSVKGQLEKQAYKNRQFFPSDLLSDINKTDQKFYNDL